MSSPNQFLHPADAEMSLSDSPVRTEILYDDKSVNVAYQQPGVTLNLETEAARSQAFDQTPYYLVGETGKRYYVSPTHEAVGVMIIKDENGDTSTRFLKGEPPRVVTIGQSCLIPGINARTEPIRSLVMLKGTRNSGMDSTVTHKRIKGHANPLVAMIPRFYSELERSKQRSEDIQAGIGHIARQIGGVK